MTCIFYDLKTTDLSPIGQIINFAFIVTDDKYNIIDEFCGDVKLNRTQLPKPEAILKNRVDVIKLQNEGQYTEAEAMQKIAQFITHYKESHYPIHMIGYNNVKFDLFFLRTSMLRNGINPYIGREAQKTRFDRDVLHIGQKVAATDSKFREMFITEEGRVSLRAEAVGQKLGILSGAQVHESKADILLTIELAKHYRDHYGIEVHNFRPYEARPFEKHGISIEKLHHNDPSKRMTLLDSGKNYTLWVSIDQWKAGEGKKAVTWYNRETSPFFISTKIESNTTEIDAALNDYKDLNLNNFFQENDSDIESRIYRMDMDKFNEFSYAIKNNNPKRINKFKYNTYTGINEPDEKNFNFAVELLNRYYLNNSFDSNRDSDINRLRNYSIYRYGGYMKTNPNDYESIHEPGIYNTSFHETYNELITRINKYISEKSGEDKILMENLKTYYETSDIMKYTGEDLLKIDRNKDTEEKK